MIKTIRTTAENPDFLQLIQLLDKDIAIKDGDEHVFFAQFNKTDSIKNVVLVYENEIAIGCGAFKHNKTAIAEIKRMFVNPEARGKGVATKVLLALEAWAKEENYNSCILETGHKFQEAIALYKKNGYKVIPNYDQYIGVDDSICFQKNI